MTLAPLEAISEQFLRIWVPLLEAAKCLCVAKLRLSVGGKMGLNVFERGVIPLCDS